jgi:hypothetical protein
MTSCIGITELSESEIFDVGGGMPPRVKWGLNWVGFVQAVELLGDGAESLGYWAATGRWP